MDNEAVTGALTTADFCATYHVGKTFLYQEIKSGRLAAVKAGSKTLILRSEANRWVRTLPKLETATVE